ncbi:uncharacterized protein LOC124666132 [Lolium rigidum]|uniref:uncharacterized protein LOC124666132 n=1 Tax=Lolium rigidum TaxID=89674 RepID=UPI001F5C144A|nr:uncharacterized protein LOC124666132 [Lolium rigidum]
MGGGAEGSALGRCFLSNIEDGERERSRRCARGRDLGLSIDDAVILVGVCCGRGNLHVDKKRRGPGGWKSAARFGRRVRSGLNLGSGAPPGRLGALFLQRWVEAELEGVDRWSAWDVEEGFITVPTADENRG